jgi:hypothetical protein
MKRKRKAKDVSSLHWEREKNYEKQNHEEKNHEEKNRRLTSNIQRPTSNVE